MIPEPEETEVVTGMSEDREDRIFNIPTETHNSLEVSISEMEDYELSEYLGDIKENQILIERELSVVNKEIAFRKAQSENEVKKRRDFVIQEFRTPVILVLSGSDRHYGVFANGAEACEWIEAQPQNLRLRFNIIRLRTKEKNRPELNDWYFDIEDSTEFSSSLSVLTD